MKKYFGWMFAAVASLTLVSAFASEDDAASDDSKDDQVAIVVDDVAE